MRREELDARTDLFSFGLVLYEMTTGHRGFSGSTATGIQEAVLGQPIVPVRQLRPDALPELESIINKAVEKDRNHRYQSAADIRRDLQSVKSEIDEKLRSASGTHAAHSSPEAIPAKTDQVSRARESARPRSTLRWLAGAGTIAALVVSGAIYLAGRRVNRLTAADTIVLGDFANSTGDPIFDDTLKQALTVTLRQSPFLNILPEGKIAKTLKLMTREPTTALTPAVASEVANARGAKHM